MKKSISFLLFLLICNISPAYPEIWPARGSDFERTGTIIPLSRNNIKISEENIRIRIADDNADVEITYIMENTKDESTITFAFPIDNTMHRDLYSPLNNKFNYSISENSGPVQYIQKDDPAEHIMITNADEPVYIKRSWLVSELKFGAAEKKQVMIRYNVSCAFTDTYECTRVLPDYGSRRFAYGFSYAAGWAQQSIGRLSVRLDLSSLSEPGIEIRNLMPQELIKNGSIYELTMNNVNIASMNDLVVEYDVSNKKFREFMVNESEFYTINKTRMNIKTSSRLKGNYSPDNMLDGKKESLWAGSNENEWIEISFKYTHISYLGLFNGAVLSEKDYKENARIASLKIDFFIKDENGEEQPLQVTENENGIIQLNDRNFEEAQLPCTLINMQETSEEISKIRITILSVYPGTKNRNSCITDFVIFSDLSSFPIPDETIKLNKKDLMKAMKWDGSILQDAQSAFKKDREIVLEAVRQCGTALQFADNSLKKDKGIVLEAVKKDGNALKYAGKPFSKNKQIVLEAVKSNGKALKSADKSLKKDKDVVLEAVKQNAEALEFADKSLKKDKDVVFAAVTQNGWSLKYADVSLKKNKEVVLAAVKTKEDILEYADKSLLKDKEFIIAAVKQKGWSLKYADILLKKDKDVILAAVKQDGRTLQFADESFKKDKAMVLEAVKQNGYALDYADESLKRDKEVVLAAVIENAWTLGHADKSLQQNRDFVLEVVKHNGEALKEAYSFRKDREIVLEAVKQNGEALKYADYTFTKDKEIVLAAIRQKGWALSDAHNSFKKDKEIVLEAIKKNAWSILFADKSIKADKKFCIEASMINP